MPAQSCLNIQHLLKAIMTTYTLPINGESLQNYIYNPNYKAGKILSLKTYSLPPPSENTITPILAINDTNLFPSKLDLEFL